MKAEAAADANKVKAPLPLTTGQVGDAVAYAAKKRNAQKKDDLVQKKKDDSVKKDDYVKKEVDLLEKKVDAIETRLKIVEAFIRKEQSVKKPSRAFLLTFQSFFLMVTL